jgi:hypothetical protein
MPYRILNFFNPEECNAANDEVSLFENLHYKCPHTDMHILGNSLFRKVSFDNKNIDYGDYFNSNIYNFNAANLLKDKLTTIFPRVEFTKHFSKPGFQIIKQGSTAKPSVWHYDNMLMFFPYATEFPDYNDNFSEYFDQYFIFTLMLSETGSFDYYPETKSSFGKDLNDALQNIPICKSHVNLVGDNCADTNCLLKEYQTIFYERGSLMVQEERTLHRIGNRDIDNNLSRTTLQAYGVLKNEVLYLFW